MEVDFPDKFLSTSVNEIAAALAKAQGEMEVAEKGANNPFFKSKYADFATIVRASRPYLAKNGLSISQPIISNSDGTSSLLTLLLHSSGQYITSTVKINPTKADHQAFGSCVTYYKRYAYAAIVGVTCDDEDDDGEGAMIRKPVLKQVAPAYETQEEEPEKISPDQYSMLAHELNGHDEVHRRLLESMKIRSLKDITRAEFRETLEKVRKVKSLESSKK
jgi:ERF superfamily